ncbi:hypothetical protein ACFLZ6_01520, partial [Nanoarchaeota archaeon]
ELILQNFKKSGFEKRTKTYKTRQSVQEAWGVLETAARGGLGRFFSLFMEEDDLQEWRQGVDDAMCSTFVLGGTDCWTSTICGTWVDNRVGGGMAYVETPSGMLTIAAHIEGERSTIRSPEGREYLYKITYVINDPGHKPVKEEKVEGQSDKEGEKILTGMAFNVEFRGERDISLYSKDVPVEGSSARIGNSAVLQYSTYNYKQVCIVFREEIEIAGDKVKEVCNRITEYGGPATTISGTPGETSGQGLQVYENQI